MVFVGIPSELCRIVISFRRMMGKDMFVVPGTGLLTDAYGLRTWGPYNLFKWALVARVCGCKLLFISVGAGPLYRLSGRFLVKTALSLAAFRSYRDDSSLKCLKDIGLDTNNDRVYPDLVFSMPLNGIPPSFIGKERRRVVGLGLMQYAGKYSADSPNHAIYAAYLENLAVFVKWLLTHEYDVRLLIGDVSDGPVMQEFRDLLKRGFLIDDEERIADDPARSVEHLVSQLAAVDVAVATRFHNVVLALLLNKPVISISFHHKCASLMSAMGLSKYCQDINELKAARLIEQFRDLEKNAEKLKPLIKQKTEEFRKALDEQYNLIFEEFLGSVAKPSVARG
jgi:polysaccharide pyruvyl transferase WcaK-like protein